MAKPARAQYLPPLHRPSPLPKSRPKQPVGDGSVLATHLAKHLDLSRQRVQQLVEENVIARLPNGRFDQGMQGTLFALAARSRAAISPNSGRCGFRQKAKTELIAIRVREKKRELIELDYATAVLDKAIAIVLTAMGVWRHAAPAVTCSCGAGSIRLFMRRACS